MERQRMTDLAPVEVWVKGYDPIAQQAELQEMIRDRWVKEGRLISVPTGIEHSPYRLAERVKDNIVAIQMELAEILERLPWKHWKSYEGFQLTDDDRIELKFEVVDVAHFLFNICIALGMTWEEFLGTFATKQEENRRRQRDGY